jgi:hypothetical protein
MELTVRACLGGKASTGAVKEFQDPLMTLKNVTLGSSGNKNFRFHICTLCITKSKGFLLRKRL